MRKIRKKLSKKFEKGIAKEIKVCYNNNVNSTMLRAETCPFVKVRELCKKRIRRGE